MPEAYKRKEVIGNCVLYLGDCIDVMPTLGKVDAVVTDPPYGMSFVSNHRNKKHKEISNDGDENALIWACNIKTMHSSYIFCRWIIFYNCPKPKSLVTWVKNNWSMGDLKHEHARQTEVALFYAGENHHFPNGRPTDVIHAQRTGNENHPTEKPVSLMTSFVNWTSGVVFDPFMGSGTTGVACVKTGRSFIALNLMRIISTSPASA